jgi:O-antigen ligase
MKPQHAIALMLLPFLSVAAVAMAAWSQRIRDAFFFLMICFAVIVERMDVNFFSQAWYRGTTRGIQVSLPEVLAFGLLVGGSLSEPGKGRRWFWPASLGLLLLYFFYACVSVISADLKLFGAFELSKILGSILMFLASAWYVRSKREWTILLVALGCAVGFEGLWAVKQRFITHVDRVAGTLDHANSLSMYFCMATPPLVAAAYAGWSRGLRWFCGVAAAFAAVGLLLTISRAGIPVFTVVVLGTALACASWKLTTSRVLVRSLLALSLAGIVTAVWQPMMNRYAEASLEEEYFDPHIDGRGIYLRLAKDIVSDHFFGVGLNNWSYYVSKTYGARLGFRFVEYDYLTSIYGTEDEEVYANSYLAAPAHNLAALTLGELGIPGLFLFLLLWLRWFSMGAPFLFDRRDDPRRVMGVGLFFSICGIFGQSITEWVYRQTPILFTFYILLGALAGIVASRKRERAEQEQITVEPSRLPAISHEELVVARA